MITRTSLEAKLGEVQYRTGALHAERRDLEEPIARAGEPAKFHMNIDVFPAADKLQVDVNLKAESEFAELSVLISGQWILTEEVDITADGTDTAMVDLATKVCAPRLIAIAEMKLNDLARSIDTPLLTFEHGLDRHLQRARTNSEGGATDEPAGQ